MTKIRLEVVTPIQDVLNDEVDEVVLPGELGQFGILPGHTTFLSTLGSGALSYRQGSSSHSLALSGGFVEVRENFVTVLADSVVLSVQGS